MPRISVVFGAGEISLNEPSICNCLNNISEGGQE